MKPIDMTGYRFSSLTAIKPVGRTKKSRNIIWLFRCDCGSLEKFDGYQVRSGRTIDCKRCSSERTRQVSLKHGLSESAEFSIWTDIQTRCYNPNTVSYQNYGGRGITVCQRWLDSFKNFLFDMGERPSKRHSIERLNNNDGYSPGNCVWATATEQNNNKRSNHKITIKGITKNMATWAKEYDLTPTAILLRERSGLTGTDLIEPSQAKGSVTFNGITDTLKGWSQRTGIKQSTIAMRISKYRWSINRALTTGAIH